MALSNLEKLVIVLDQLPDHAIERFVRQIGELRKQCGQKFFTLTELESIHLAKQVLDLVYLDQKAQVVKNATINAHYDLMDLTVMVRYASDSYLTEMRRGIIKQNPEVLKDLTVQLEEELSLN